MIPGPCLPSQCSRSIPDRVLKRLLDWYPLNSDETLGDAVPRAALDPEQVVHLDDTEALINRFLVTLDHRANPFLTSPERMREQGLPGTPYTFNIQADRRARFQW